MKVGMIFECGPDGADKKVCEHLARKLQEDIEISSVTLNNKPNLISECGDSAAVLLQQGCERIIIIWDLYPAWREKGEKPCLKEDRNVIMESLSKTGVKSSQVHLVCIEQELEAWLLADGDAISQVVSKPTHPVRIPNSPHPERRSNPKKYLNRFFKEHGISKGYPDRDDAEKIVKNIVNLNKLKCCPSFVRFQEKLTGITSSK
jgi:hypothetical protein